MDRPALLLFAHQARSYAGLIQEYVRRLDVALLVLSSRPRDPRDLADLSALGVDRLWHVEDEYLAEAHLDPVLDQARAEGYGVVAALATFEGYRVLMALANRRLVAADADPQALRDCMDKYLCREALAREGLSRARASVLDAESLPALRSSGRRLFVKPRRGAGSFACFRFDDSVTPGRLAALQRQMREDRAFRAIFAGQYDFIAEDQLAGDEYSLEVLVADGEAYVVGVHAKYLDDSSGTTLETGNSLPAPRLADAQQLAGERYAARCLAALGLREGCYHIEARHDPRDGHWDVIEINVRMGGALINQSVGVFTGGLSMLELWVRMLCAAAADRREALRARLAALRESTRRAAGELSHGSVFFSRYGQRNRRLEQLSIAQLQPPPDVVDLPVREGMQLPDSERGIFILNALWKVPIADIDRQLHALSAMLDEKLVVRYSDAAGSAAPSTAKEKP
jgi:biotin carboxylase